MKAGRLFQGGRTGHIKTGMVIFAAALLIGASPPKPDYPAMIEALGKTVADNFYNPYLLGSEWERTTRYYAQRAAEVSDDAEFRRLASEMMSTLNVSHSNITAPSSAGSRSEPPLVIEEDVIVHVAELSHARAQGLRPGFRLLDQSVLDGPLGSEAQVPVFDCAGTQRTITARREAALWPPPEPSFRWQRIRSAPDRTIGYLRIDAFDDDGAELADRAMESFENTDGLVIDLRNNQGGNASALRLASYFTGDEGPGLILLGRDYIQRLGRSPTAQDARNAPQAFRTYTTARVGEALQDGGSAAALWTEDLAGSRYTKPVMVLIGPETASAAEGFAWVMRLRSEATLIGRRSQAALLNADRFEFAPGWSVRVPTAGIWAPDGKDYGDRPIDPDVSVPVDAEALCDGRDPALERALSLLADAQD